MIRVLVVEDSPTARMLLTQVLNSDPEIRVVGTAANGEEGVQQAVTLKPDLITMDIRMPRMDGFEATRRIMEECPTPIIVVSASVETSDLQITFNAIQAGALEVIEKPAGIQHHDYAAIREHLVTTVKLMAEVKVIRRRSRKLTGPISPVIPASHPRRSVAVLAIGASTGGPTALSAVLSSLPRNFSAPVLVVQHMSAGFLSGLISWLQLKCQLRLHIAKDGQCIYPGEVYFAPDNYHLICARREVLGLSQTPPVSHVRPSATILFDSVARVYEAETAGLLLTGMGDDGAVGLKAIHDRGGLTLAQDEASCVVYGMPKVAVELGAVDHILPLDRITPTLMSLIHHQR
ncbi:MAG: chemotaxis-specific protein-glutamate methyltransferase CheB [Anaerolineales bacterium]